MKNAKLLLLGLLLVLFGSFTASIIQSSNDAIKVNEIIISAKNAAPLSARLFIPPNATTENPAPAVIIAHGYVNQKEVMANFSIEFARRGYVVIAPDLSGHGGSQVIDNDGSRGVGDILRYAHTLPFIDKANVALVGHSMGGWSAVTAAVDNPELVRTLIVVGSAQGGHKVDFMLGAPWIPDDSPFNFGVEFGRYDEFVAINYFDQKKAADFVKSLWLMGPFHTDEPVQLGQVYGDFAKGTGRMATQSAETHAGVHQSKTAIANVIGMLELSSPAPVQLAAQDQVWPYKEVATASAYIGLILFMLGVLIKAFSTPYFSSLVQPRKVHRPQAALVYFTSVALIVCAVAYLLVPLQMAAMQHLGVNQLFPLLFANTALVFFATVQLSFLGLFFVWHLCFAKNRGESLISYGLSTSTAQSELCWGYLAKALGIALLTVGSGYVLLTWVYSTLSVDVRWWMLLIRPLEPHRLATAAAYVLPFTAIFLVNNLLAFGWLRMKDFGSALRTGVIWTLAVFLVNALGVMIVIAAQMASLYGTGQPYIGEVGYDTLLVILGNGFIPLFAVTSLMSTYCLLRTGNIYTGSLLSGLLATWMVVCYQPY